MPTSNPVMCLGVPLPATLQQAKHASTCPNVPDPARLDVKTAGAERTQLRRMAYERRAGPPLRAKNCS
jgi:hypothetical protein